MSKLTNCHLIFLSFSDMRKEEHVKGRSINLALSVRGLAALEAVGLKEKIMPYGIPMYARLIHNKDGTKKRIPYGKSHQVRKRNSLESFVLKDLNQIM